MIQIICASIDIEDVTEKEIGKIMAEFFHDIIECLTAALDAKDAYTSGHSTRVGNMAYDIARKIKLSDKECDDIHIAGHLHDIGKIGISEHVLNKTGKLDADEWTQIQLHPQMGYNILKKSDILTDIALMVLYHHERWDGNGYPKKLKGKEIPLGARIIAICDSIDAMTSNRPYRSAYSWEYCKKEIYLNKGKQFDPYLVDEINDLWPIWKENLNFYE